MTWNYVLWQVGIAVGCALLCFVVVLTAFSYAVHCLSTGNKEPGWVAWVFGGSCIGIVLCLGRVVQVVVLKLLGY